MTGDVTMIQTFIILTIVNIVTCHLFLRNLTKKFENILQKLGDLGRQTDPTHVAELDLNSRLSQLQRAKFSINMTGGKK